MLHFREQAGAPTDPGGWSEQDRFAAFERRGWETLSTAYHDVWGGLTAAFAPALIAPLGDLRGRALLDVAAGPGYAAAAARERGALATGVDFAHAMVEQARSLHPAIEFIRGDAHDLPFPDCAFEAVICNFGLQHFSDLERACREMARVLRPGGRLAVTIWAGDAQNGAGDVLDRAVAAHAEGPAAAPAGPDYHELATEEARLRLLAGAGFARQGFESRLAVLDWRMRDPDVLFQAELQGSVRSGARLREQAPEPLARIRAAMAADIRARFAAADGFSVPLAAHVVSARRA